MYGATTVAPIGRARERKSTQIGPDPWESEPFEPLVAEMEAMRIDSRRILKTQKGPD
jgi:hypothetical protein